MRMPRQAAIGHPTITASSVLRATIRIQVPADRTTEIHPGDVVKVHNTFFTDAVSILSPISGVAASAATAAVIQ